MTGPAPAGKSIAGGVDRRFADLAQELGIAVAPDGARGWSATTLPEETAAAYGAELAQLTAAITAYRRAEVTGPGTTTSRNTPPATCGCAPGRRDPRGPVGAHGRADRVRDLRKRVHRRRARRRGESRGERRGPGPG